MTVNNFFRRNGDSFLLRPQSIAPTGDCGSGYHNTITQFETAPAEDELAASDAVPARPIQAQIQGTARSG
jgi:hypothetical protein